MKDQAGKEIDDLLALHGSRIWRVVVRLLGASADAEDCFQDVFVEYWRNGPTADHAGALLARIATRRAIDRLRRRRVARRWFLRAADDGDARRSPQPSDATEGAELADALTEALATLPEPQATAFCLTQLDGLDHAEVAAVLGRSTNGVAVLLRRARLKLQSQLAAFNPANA